MHGKNNTKFRDDPQAKAIYNFQNTKKGLLQQSTLKSNE
jgi:hypothetical protein